MHDLYLLYAKKQLENTAPEWGISFVLAIMVYLNPHFNSRNAPYYGHAILKKSNT